MKLYKILTAIPLIFAISLSTQAESFKLLSIKMAKPDPSFPPATIKKYQALKPVTVKYNYGLDTYDEPVLYINYSKKESSFQDLTNWSSIVDNIKDPIVVKNIIKLMPTKINNNCDYVGTATVMVKNIELIIPEIASEINFYSDITKVISITKPKAECNKY